MEEWHTILLGEGEQHPHFNIDLLNALHAVLDPQFRHAIITLKNDYDKGKLVTTEEIISKANHKHDKILSRKEHQHQKRKYLNLAIEQSTPENPTPNNNRSGPIESWRKKKIKDTDVTEKWKNILLLPTLS